MEQTKLKLHDIVGMVNVAESLTQEELSAIGQRVWREWKIDVDSRAEWKDKTEQAMELALQAAKPKQYPWPKASNVIYPAITTASMQFAARAYPAIINSRNIVRGVVIGDDTGTPEINPDTKQPLINPQTQQPVWKFAPGEKRLRAERIGDHMSWQLLDEMEEWEEETDVLLHQLPVVGSVFRKSLFNSALGRNQSIMVSALSLVVNYKAKCIYTTPRLTEEIKLYPYEIEELEQDGSFISHNYGPAVEEDNSGSDTDAPHKFLEQHRRLDLDGDGYSEPYIVTVHEKTCHVARIVARFELKDVKVDKHDKVLRIKPIHYYTQYNFLPNPDGGIYGMGFSQLLKPINEAINTTLNQLIDAGHLANVGGGLIGKGLSMTGGAMRFQPGEYKPVNVSGAALRDNVFPFPFKEPSLVLFQLLGLLIKASQDISSVKDVMTGDLQQNGDQGVPATTTLALIEQGMKVFTAIYKRVFRALKQEFTKLYRLNGIYLPVDASYRKGDLWQNITPQDYEKGSGVEPVADPNMVSDMQRLGRAQFLMQFNNDPLVNQIEIRQRVFDAALIDNPERLLVTTPPPPNPEGIAKLAELQIKAKRASAEEVRDLAQAILYLAQADKAVGDGHISWIESQLNVLKTAFEASLNANQQAGLPNVASPSGDQGSAQISQ